MSEHNRTLDAFLETPPKDQREPTGPLHPVPAASAYTKSNIGSKRLPRKLDDYLDVLPPQCDRCRNNGQLPGNFLVAVLCKPCLLQVLVDLGVVTKINHNKRLVCPDCRTPVTFPRQVIFTNGRIKHSGRCETHGWLEWWLNEPRTVA